LTAHCGAAIQRDDAVGNERIDLGGAGGELRL